MLNELENMLYNWYNYIYYCCCF